MTKAEARRLVRERLAAIAPERLAAAAEALRRRALAELGPRRSVMAYLGVAGELDTRPLLEALLTSGVELYLPRIEGEAMVAARVDDLARLVPGRFGIPAPPAEAPTATTFDVILVPGVAFTADGGRVGRGRGFYDRFLPGVTGERWALAFSVQAVDDVELDTWDVRMDRILWQPV